MDIVNASNKICFLIVRELILGIIHSVFLEGLRIAKRYLQVEFLVYYNENAQHVLEVLHFENVHFEIHECHSIDLQIWICYFL